MRGQPLHLYIRVGVDKLIALCYPSRSVRIGSSGSVDKLGIFLRSGCLGFGWGTPLEHSELNLFIRFPIHTFVHRTGGFFF